MLQWLANLVAPTAFCCDCGAVRAKSVNVNVNEKRGDDESVCA